MQNIASGISSVLKAISGVDRRHHTTAIVVAAGASTRMQTDTPKQFLPLGGIPVLARTLLAFDHAEEIRDIVLVIREEDRETVEALLAAHPIKKIQAVVSGGDTRQESVLNGLRAVDEKKTKYIAIHDGARPLVTTAMIKAVCEAAYKYGGATAATKAHDSIKLEEKSGFIGESLDRNKIWLAQTPQVFKANLYRAAAYSAMEEGFSATDDCALVERIRGAIKLVDCGKCNLKITTTEDMQIAEALLTPSEDAL